MDPNGTKAVIAATRNDLKQSISYCMLAGFWFQQLVMGFFK